MTKSALILAVAIVIGGFLAGGRYTPATFGGTLGGAIVVDQFTGTTSFCTMDECRKLQNAD